MSLLLFKRDNTGTGYPAPEQLEVGEIVINSVTGKLYTKLVDGAIIEFIGQKICFDPAPEASLYYENVLVSNDIINQFCCAGALIEFEVKKLKQDPAVYGFELTELTSNTLPTDVSIQTPKYSLYEETIAPVPPATGSTTITYRKAIVPVNLSISGNSTGISLFKFSIIGDPNRPPLVDKIITIKCQDNS